MPWGERQGARARPAVEPEAEQPVARPERTAAAQTWRAPGRALPEARDAAAVQQQAASLAARERPGAAQLAARRALLAAGPSAASRAMGQDARERPGQRVPPDATAPEAATQVAQVPAPELVRPVVRARELRAQARSAGPALAQSRELVVQQVGLAELAQAPSSTALAQARPGAQVAQERQVPERAC